MIIIMSVELSLTFEAKISPRLEINRTTKISYMKNSSVKTDVSILTMLFKLSLFLILYASKPDKNDSDIKYKL